MNPTHYVLAGDQPEAFRPVLRYRDVRLGAPGSPSYADWERAEDAIVQNVPNTQPLIPLYQAYLAYHGPPEAVNAQMKRDVEFAKQWVDRMLTHFVDVHPSYLRAYAYRTEYDRTLRMETYLDKLVDFAFDVHARCTHNPHELDFVYARSVLGHIVHRLREAGNGSSVLFPMLNRDTDSRGDKLHRVQQMLRSIDESHAQFMRGVQVSNPGNAGNPGNPGPAVNPYTPLRS